MASRNRGKPKPKLRDLSRSQPTREETTALYQASKNAEPITAAIIGAVLVEIELENLLRRRLTRQSDEQWQKLVEETGPLSTFYRKILMGRTLRLYGDDVADNLHIVRNIRNTFAHAKRLISFDHELIVAELKSTKIPKVRKRAHKEVKEIKFGAQYAYLYLCHNIWMILVDRHTDALRASTRHWTKKLERMKQSTSRAQSPINALYRDQPSPLSILLSSPHDQTSGAIPDSQQGWLGGVLQRAAKNGDKSKT